MNRHLPRLCLIAVVSLQSNQMQAQNVPGSAVWHECEDTAGCTVWTFNGADGQGQWSNGSIAKLHIQRLDSHGVSILRSDTRGTVAGLQATYTGTRAGNIVTGTVTWTWPGHGQSSRGTTNWHASLLDQLTRPSDAAVGRATPALTHVPAAMSECEGDQCTSGGGGALWLFDGTRGQAMWRYGAVADLTVTSFDGHAIVLERADPPGTVSSRWAGPDGYFRAHYSGSIDGDRVYGVVYFGGDKSHPATWYAKISSTPCDGKSPCPLLVDQIRTLKERVTSAHLPQASAMCGRILSDTEGPADANRRVGLSSSVTASICRSGTIRAAMQRIEDEQVKDPGAREVGEFACYWTGVCGDVEHPENIRTTILDSRPAIDSGGFTKGDPGSFLCQGLFARGDLHLELGANAQAGSEAELATMKEASKRMPHFEENYKVIPMQAGTYKLILVDVLGLNAQPYATQFTYR